MNSIIKEKLEKGNWFVTCENEEEYQKLMSACSKVGLKWISGSALYEHEIEEFPVYIGVDNVHGSIKSLLYSNNIADWYEDEHIQNITELFFDKSNETDTPIQSSDKSNEIITRMKYQSWYVKCENEQQIKILLDICDKLGLKWIGDDNLSATQFIPQNNEYFPICIGVDQQFNEENGEQVQSLTYTDPDYSFISVDAFSIYDSVVNITEEFFKIFNSSSSLTLLANAILENKVVYLKDRNDKWFKPDFTQYKIGDNSINNQISTPLNITPEMWNLIDPRYKFVAMDSDGDIYFYEFEPKPDPDYLERNNDQFVWINSNSCGSYQLSIFNIDTTNIIPEKSLTKRP